MSIICIGDSLTYGRVGYSYIPFLKTPEKVINKGINGDTTLCALKCLKKYSASPDTMPLTLILSALVQMISCFLIYPPFPHCGGYR